MWQQRSVIEEVDYRMRAEHVLLQAHCLSTTIRQCMHSNDYELISSFRVPGEEEPLHGSTHIPLELMRRGTPEDLQVHCRMHVAQCERSLADAVRAAAREPTAAERASAQTRVADEPPRKHIVAAAARLQLRGIRLTEVTLIPQVFRALLRELAARHGRDYPPGTESVIVLTCAGETRCRVVLPKGHL